MVHWVTVFQKKQKTLVSNISNPTGESSTESANKVLNDTVEETKKEWGNEKNTLLHLPFIYFIINDESFVGAFERNTSYYSFFKKYFGIMSKK